MDTGQLCDLPWKSHTLNYMQSFVILGSILHQILIWLFTLGLRLGCIKKMINWKQQKEGIGWLKVGPKLVGGKKCKICEVGRGWKAKENMQKLRSGSTLEKSWEEAHWWARPLWQHLWLIFWCWCLFWGFWYKMSGLRITPSSWLRWRYLHQSVSKTLIVPQILLGPDDIYEIFHVEIFYFLFHENLSVQKVLSPWAGGWRTSTFEFKLRWTMINQKPNQD